MSNYDDYDGDLDSGLDPEGPSAADLERFGGEFITCPNCGHEAYDQADTCDRCGRDLAAAGTDAVSGRLRWVLILALVAGLLGVLSVF